MTQFPVVDFFKVNLSNASPHYYVTFDAIVYCQHNGSNDFDNGQSVNIHYPARQYTAASVVGLCSSAAYSQPMMTVQAGDRVSMTTGDPTSMVLYVMRLVEI